MAKKRGARKNGQFDQRTMESMSAKIQQLMGGQHFSSIEEANKFLSENIVGISLDTIEYKPSSALEEAQSIMWDAFDEPSKRKRIALAEKALKVSPDCADALILLAEEQAKTIDETIALYRKAVDAGKRSLGEETFNKSKVPFWSDHKTRPYMRAVAGLAQCLYATREVSEAIDLWFELLRLNPNDNQGVRFMLAPALVEANRLDEAEKLFRQYRGEKSAHLLYARAICCFKKHGCGPLAHQALNDAVRANPFVIATICGELDFPNQVPHSYSPGSPEEAFSYLGHGARDWVECDGLTDWLGEYMRQEVQKHTLSNTFPGLNFENEASNVVDFDSFRKR